MSGQLQEGELLFAYLDDVYVVSKPDARGFCKSISKTRVWNQAGEYPFGMVALGDDVWSPHGVKILGIPVGSNEFVEAKIEVRLADERLLWEAILGSGLPMRMADFVAVRRSEMPSSSPHCATKPGGKARSGAL